MRGGMGERRGGEFVGGVDYHHRCGFSMSRGFGEEREGKGVVL